MTSHSISSRSGTVQHIAALERQLGCISSVKPRKRKKRQALADVILSVVPDDRSFSHNDILAWVREAQPDRSFSKATLITLVNRLISEGALKRVQSAAGRQRALYAVPSFECEPEAPTMLDMAEQVLREAGKPLTPVEIMVALLDAGYQPDTSPNASLESLVKGMRQARGRFAGRGDCWEIASP